MTKFKYLSILALLILGITLYSCNTQDDNQDNDTPRLKATDFSYLGKEHNEILKSLFSELKDRKTKKFTEKLDLEAFLNKELINSSIVPKNEINISIQELKEGIKMFKSTNFSKINEDTNSYIQDLNVSEKVKQYLIRLDNYVNYIDNNTITQINQLEDEIENDNDLTQIELTILFSATEVGKYSYQYWSENVIEWIALNENSAANKSSILSKKDCDSSSLEGSNSCAGQLAGNIVKGDIAGGVGAGIGAAIINVVPGPGQVAYGGAILGGAVGTSATVAVSALLDWIWD